MRSYESLRIEYLIYKLELLINSFKRENQTKYIKNLNQAKNKLTQILSKLEKGARFRSKEIQDELLASSNIINKVMEKINLEEDKKENIQNI